jgi:hypothetical protein
MSRTLARITGRFRQFWRAVKAATLQQLLQARKGGTLHFKPVARELTGRRNPTRVSARSKKEKSPG